MLLSERLPLAASLYAEAPALVRHGQSIQYGELHYLANQLGSVLFQEGLRAGDRIAFIGDPDPQMVVALYAAVGIGAIPTVVSPLLTAPEMAAILDDAEPKIVVHDKRRAEAVYTATNRIASTPLLFATEDGSNSCSLRSLLQKDLPPPPGEACDRQMDDIAAIIYTGGTTGRPKGVMHSHRGMAAWNQFTPSAGFGYDRGRKVLVLNLSHLVGQFQLWATMAAGGCLVFLDEYPANAYSIMEAVERERITHLSTVGPLLHDLTIEASAAGRELRSLKVIGCGGSVISPHTMEKAIAQFPGALLVNNYSQAECGMAISRLLPIHHLEDPTRLRSVGRPEDLASFGEQAFQVRIMNSEGHEAAVNEPGEIVVRGAQMMMGYWRQPEATDETIDDGWIRTGDAGCIDAEGYLYLLDRLKDMVIVGGSNVFCPEVEQVIAELEQVAEAAVIGLPLPGEGEEIAACVVLRDGTTLELEQLRELCEPSLARHKWPAKLFILDKLPRTAVDKVDKRRIREQLQSIV
ncbi:class I adenylate-forming enzyme family protein [Paenibacillus soyae]|uniref:Acyl--CoA ligase n=1 Tax=Paenibacillus soyae TaxID=2969249 RepID=A0A9X2SBC3_9BACL|nr:class I adenylate-forming enzyme family protein [Paenibacillus soyae]MCR2807529.1 acyl--CoA ligase [Paenibacillus soyae]